jgi:hypothetical protein
VDIVRGLLTSYDQLKKLPDLDLGSSSRGTRQAVPAQVMTWASRAAAKAVAEAVCRRLPQTHEMAFKQEEPGNSSSALHIAVNCSDKSKGFACAQLLLSPVVAACATRTKDAGKRLLKDTAFKQQLGGRRETALHMAAMRGDLKLVTLLLEISKPFCDLALVPDGVGFNAWHYAAFSGCSEVVETMFMFDTTMMFKEQDKTRIASIAEDGAVATEAINPEDWTVESTAEHLLREPARTWWKKERMLYDEVFAASTNCINALLVGASVAASVTYSAAVAPPAWFQADVDPPGWLTAECSAGQQITTSNTTVLAGVLSWLGLAERLQSVTEGKECDPSAAARKELARAFISLNVTSFYFSVACIVIGVVVLLPQYNMLSRAQAESRLRWLLWATLCLLLAVVAEVGAMSVVLYAGWKLNDVQDSMFNAHWWWLGSVLVGVFVLFSISRAWRTFEVARPLHLSGWFLVWSTGSSTRWHRVLEWSTSWSTRWPRVLRWDVAALSQSCWHSVCLVSCCCGRAWLRWRDKCLPVGRQDSLGV